MLKKQELPNKEVISYYEIIPEKSEGQPTIVFIHGNVSNYQWWLDIAQHPKLKKFHMVLIDLRGFGLSTYNSKCSLFGDWAQDVVEFIKAKQLKRVFINGWGLGGAIALKTAQLYPQAVEKLVLISSASHMGVIYKDLDGNVIVKPEDLMKHPKIASFLKLKAENDHKGVTAFFEKIFYNKMKNYPEQKKRILEKGILQQVCEIDVEHALIRTDININKIKAKTLAIHGEANVLIKAEPIELTGKLLGEFQLWDGHQLMIPFQDTDRYCERIAKFFEE